MLKSGCAALRLVLCIATGIASSACGVEEDGPPGESTVEKVSPLTATDPVRKWYQVTGLLTDIATANGAASRWGIDTNWGPGGFRVVKWSGSQWAATSGRGVRIALKGTGDANQDDISDVFVPWVVTSDGHINRATSSAGNAWVAVPDLPAGVFAIDIGSGSPATDMRMWAVGNNGRVYEFDGSQWSINPNSPTDAIRVSGPVRGHQTWGKQVLVLTSLGRVCALTQVNGQERWVDPGLFLENPDDRRNDISAAVSLDQAYWQTGWGFMSSIMVTSSKAGESNYVRTWDPTPGGGGFFWTGPYKFNVPGLQLTIPAPPMAVSSDVDRNRVWIVTTDHRVYYGE